MTAQILAFPSRCSATPPKTEFQIQFERVAELLGRRAGCSVEKARAGLTKAIIADSRDRMKIEKKPGVRK